MGTLERSTPTSPQSHSDTSGRACGAACVEAVPTSPISSLSPSRLEYGISSFVFQAKRPFHPERLHATFGSRPLLGALAGLLRLKGFAWLATWRGKQAHAALAGTQFTMTPGNPWWAAIPRQQWPAGLAEELQQAQNPTEPDAANFSTWDVQHGDRRTELVCIGRELDSEAANAQLEACLLTTEEMAAGEESWRTYTDPFAKQDSPDDGVEIVSGVTEGNLRKFMGMTSADDYDDILGFMFETLGEESWLQGDREHALKQIKECAPALRELFGASADKRRTQSSFLKAVTTLVTAPKHGGAMLKKTPKILEALYDYGLLEHDVVLKWHAQKPMHDAGKKIRMAASPFIKWLRGPEEEEEEYSAAYWASVEAAEPPDLATAPPRYDNAMQCPTPTDYENLKVDNALEKQKLADANKQLLVSVSVTKPMATISVAISLATPAPSAISAGSKEAYEAKKVISSDA